MLAITRDAVLKCAHGGVVHFDPQQEWVTIEGRAILVEGDPLGRRIWACPQATPVNPPCRRTISVNEAKSYSAMVRIDGKRICMDTITGTTDWSLLSVIPFTALEAGQQLVSLGA